jgi:hypothetical protein
MLSFVCRIFICTAVLILLSSFAFAERFSVQLCNENKINKINYFHVRTHDPKFEDRNWLKSPVPPKSCRTLFMPQNDFDCTKARYKAIYAGGLVKNGEQNICRKSSVITLR